MKLRQAYDLKKMTAFFLVRSNITGRMLLFFFIQSWWVLGLKP